MIPSLPCPAQATGTSAKTAVDVSGTSGTTSAKVATSGEASGPGGAKSTSTGQTLTDPNAATAAGGHACLPASSASP